MNIFAIKFYIEKPGYPNDMGFGSLYLVVVQKRQAKVEDYSKILRFVSLCMQNDLTVLNFDDVTFQSLV